MPGATLDVGDLAPDFELPDEQSRPVKLSDFRGRRAILYFYPKDDTPGCTTQACGFRDAYPRIEDRNAVVIGVSPDGAKSHQRFKTKHNLPFVLLSDVDHAVAEAYGVWGAKTMFGNLVVGVIRSHFVVDENGRLIDVQTKVKAVDSVQRALHSLGA
jgi:peroxiredoxin Q/BCP